MELSLLALASLDKKNARARADLSPRLRTCSKMCLERDDPDFCVTVYEIQENC